MGYSLSWLAVKGIPKDSVLSTLNLQGTGVFGELPESRLTGLMLPSGWYLVIAERAEYRAFMDKEILGRLSVSGDVVTCFVEEHVMVSQASYWQSGKELWSVRHVGDTGGIEHLEAKGELPPFYGPIRDQLQRQQRDAGGKESEVDFIFEIPVEVAQTLTGYRHDEDIPTTEEEPFETLEPTAKRSWLRNLLGL